MGGRSSGAWHGTGKQIREAGVPGIRPEEAVRTTTPPSLFVSFDVLLSEEQGGLGFCPLPSHTGFFTGEVPQLFLSGSLPAVAQGAWSALPWCPTSLTVQAKTALSKVCPAPPKTAVSLLVSSV